MPKKKIVEKIPGYNIGRSIGIMHGDFNDMNKVHQPGVDKYFHCKANYQSARTGKTGLGTSAIISTGKEIKDVFTNTIKNYNNSRSITYRNFSKSLNESIKDSYEDYQANISGWSGAIKGKSLQNSCKKHRTKKVPDKY